MVTLQKWCKILFIQFSNHIAFSSLYSSIFVIFIIFITYHRWTESAKSGMQESAEKVSPEKYGRALVHNLENMSQENGNTVSKYGKIWEKNWEGLRQKSEGLFLNWGNYWLQSKKKWYWGTTGKKEKADLLIKARL